MIGLENVNRWRPSHRYDREALPLANRHYSRKSPDSPQFVRPGFNKVFKAGYPVSALWVSVRQKHVDHAWPGTWECAMFRNEGGVGLSSELIREAVAATMGEWGAAPDAGFLTFIAPECIENKRNPGFCFKKAGFELVGQTKVHGRLALVLPAADFPEPFKVGQQGLFTQEEAPDGRQRHGL
jgi:hypothetical protein